MNMDSPDLQAKYQKLALEYSKLKGQNQVLKKAVIEEQGRSCHLKESLKSQDQSLRKAEQELDSLNFRNQQLTKRLSLLQEDLERAKAKPRKGQAKTDSSVTNSTIPDHDVYVEELQCKIKENAMLHAEISELKDFYENKLIESENSSLQSSEDILKDAIKRLEGEIVSLKTRCQEKDAMILNLWKQKGDSGLNDKALIDQSGPDGGDSDAYSEDIKIAHLTNNDVKKSPGRSFKDFADPIRRISSGFVGFFTSFSALVEASADSSNTYSKHAGLLTGELDTWHLLSRRFEEMSSRVSPEDALKLDAVVGLDAFSKAMSGCASSLRKLLPVLSEKWSSSQEGQLNGPWRSAVGRLVSSWSAINPHVSSLAAYSEGRTTLTVCAVNKIVYSLRERVSKLHLTTKELLSAWELLRPATSSDSDRVHESLASIEIALNEICILLSEIVSHTEEESLASSTSPADVSSPVKQQSSVLLSSQVDSGIKRNSSQESACQQLGGWEELSMAQQLAQATSRLSELEEEREHWRLEHQLLNHRFQKVNTKCEAFETDLKALKTTADSETAKQFSADQNTKETEGLTSSSLIGQVSSSASEDESREKEIRDYFTNRCSHLYMQLSSCASQAALYQDECGTLIRRITLCEEECSKKDQDADQQRKKIAEVQEALTTTSRNYEEQISTMSDYLADLNEKISRQADQIEELKFELKKKGKK